MKKGQLMSQPLVYIFALVVGALVLAYGISVLYDLVSVTNEVQTVDAINDFDDIVQTYYVFDEGSNKVWTLRYPNEVDALCFYDDTKNLDCKIDGMVCDPDDLSEGLSLYLADKNVYILPLDLGYNTVSYNIDHVEPEGGNPVCVSNGKDIRITSYKDYVGVSFAE